MTTSEDDPLLESSPASYGAAEPSYSSVSNPPLPARFDRPPPKQYEVCLSYIFSIISGFCLIGCNVCIKLASSDFPVSSWQMNVVRGVVALLVTIPVLCWKKNNICGPPDVKTRLRIVAMACTSGTMLMCVYEGIDRLPFGDYSAIAFSSPVFTMILSIFLLKDHFGIYRSMLGIILTLGVVIISRPTSLFPTDSDISATNVTDSNTNNVTEKSTDVVGIAFALSGAVLSAWITILVRQVSHIHFSVQVFWFSVGNLVVSLAGMLLVDTEPLFTSWTLTTWLLSTAQAVLALLAAILILKALRWISPTRNKIIRSFQVVVSYIIQVVAFDTIPHPTDYLGALMIILAVLGVVVEDRVVKMVNCRYF